MVDVSIVNETSPEANWNRQNKDDLKMKMTSKMKTTLKMKKTSNMKKTSKMKTTRIQNNTQQYTKIHNNRQQQAGAELCQAQLRLSWHYLVAS